MQALPRASHWLFVILASALLAACATGPQVRTDHDPTADFSQYRTWSYYSPIAMEALRATRVLHAADQDPFPAPARIRVITIANQKGTAANCVGYSLDRCPRIQAINAAIVKLDEDGTMARIQKEWFGQAVDLPKTVPEPSI